MADLRLRRHRWRSHRAVERLDRPALGCHRFGDEWHLLLQIEEVGFARWVGMAFAESFCPLFKLLWGGAVRIFVPA